MQVVITAIPFIGLLWNFSDRASKQENRLTRMEERVANALGTAERNGMKIDEIEKQHKILIAMSERLDMLSNDLKELKNDWKNFTSK